MHHNTTSGRNANYIMTDERCMSHNISNMSIVQQRGAVEMLYGRIYLLTLPFIFIGLK
jgi:hypothetical protein